MLTVIAAFALDLRYQMQMPNLLHIEKLRFTLI